MRYADTYIPAQPLEHLGRRVPQGSYYPLHRILVVRGLALPYPSATYSFPIYQLLTLPYPSATYSYYRQNIILQFQFFLKKNIHFHHFFKITHLHHILVVTPGKQGQTHAACRGVSSQRRAVYRLLQRGLVSRVAEGFSSASRGEVSRASGAL
jgi:hypothetical protein